MLKIRYDIPLDGDDASRFLPWIIGAMIFLAVMASAAFLVTYNTTQHWKSQTTGTLTVQVTAETGQSDSPSQADRVAATLSALKALPGVSAVPVNTEEAKELLRPWLGEGVSLSELPVPTLIDVQVPPDGSVALHDIQLQLRGIDGVTLDDHQTWLRDLRKAARIFESTALVVLSLVTTATLLVITFAARSGLAIHSPVIGLLHAMGATDTYVARQFQRHAFQVSLKGGFGGFLAACSLLILFYTFGRTSESFLLPPLRLSVYQAFLLILIPLGSMILSSMTARWVALRTLSSMP